MRGVDVHGSVCGEQGAAFRAQYVLGCGSFVRGRKRKKGDSIPFILSRRDYIARLHDECPSRASTHQMNYPVSQSYIYQTPLVHDSPATGPSTALRT